ncbi:MAG: prepilin-type N-terminal cleavage/methylation domain-containing protein, partial [Comamonas sp.]
MTQFFQRTAVSRPRLAQCGFSLLEMAIAMVVAGLMSWAAFSGYETLSEQQEIERARAQAQQLQSMVRAFALRHGRLPCPAS